MTQRASWRARSACLAPKPDLFFDLTPEGIQKARDICWGCPVLAQCANWALTHYTEIPDGIFAGLIPEQRRAIHHGERIWKDWRPDWIPGRGCRRHHIEDLYLLDDDWYCLICGHVIQFVTRMEKQAS